MNKTTDLSVVYKKRVPILNKIAKEIKQQLRDILHDIPRVDLISTRVKEASRFVEKANNVDLDSGEPRYKYPLDEIQDQIGARIVVFYKRDVDPVVEKILAEIRPVEDRKIESSVPEHFEYEARHFVCFIPHDIYENYKPPIDFFELQVSTLFQHAWAQANHDLGYKPFGKLAYDDRRRIAWVAAQAWGADEIFNELWNRFQNVSSHAPL